MAEISLIFIPFPTMSHLAPAVELAKILLSRDHRISITCLIIHTPRSDPSITSFTSSIVSDRFQFLDIPNEDSESATSLPLFNFFKSKKPLVKKMITDLIESHPCRRLAGFVLDMFSNDFIDMSAEFNIPSYIYYTSGSSYLALLFHVQKLCDDEGLEDVADFKDSGMEFSLPRFENKVPARLLPSVAFKKEEGMSAAFVNRAREFRKTKGILVNSFIELESHAVESMKLDHSIPPVYSVGPVLNMGHKTSLIKQEQEAEIMKWLDSHPPASVVFLCFGSMGAFGSGQVKEIARGLESSGCRFLWALRKPSSSEAKFAPPEEYEDFSEVLPEGFLERTARVGKVIGWAPQTAVLGHRSVGGFVSHCGWNSILESLWFGVPIATWPMYAEQQINAFEAVKEMGIAVEISLDYQMEMDKLGSEESMIISGKQIERGIRQLMEEDSEVRKKVKMMMQKSREAVAEGGSSYNFVQQFINDARNNIGF